MDSLTHVLAGALVAQLGFRQRLGRSATWMAALTAALPDADIAAVPLLRALGAHIGPFDSLAYHRGASHSLLVLPLLALAPAGLWWLVCRRQFGRLWLLCALAGFCQPLLDWCTSYGTQMLWPASHHRFALDALPIVDVIYTPLLVLSLAGCWTVRRIRRGSGRADIAVGWGGLGISTAYILAGLAMHHAAIAQAREAYRALSAEQPPATQAASAGAAQAWARYSAYPTLGTIFRWRVTVQTPDWWYAGQAEPLTGRPVDLKAYPQSRGPLVEEAMNDPTARVFVWFANGQIRAVQKRPDGRDVVELNDMRYAMPADAGESMWQARVTFDASGRVASVEHVHGFGHQGRGQMLRQFWRAFRR